jgi:hypothetical protein
LKRESGRSQSIALFKLDWLWGNLTRSYPSGATLKSVVTTGNDRGPALAWRKERSGYRNLILTISPRKDETPKRRNAETQKRRNSE